MIPLLLSLALTFQVSGPTLESPQPESVSDCTWIYKIIMEADAGWYWELEDPAERAQFFEVCDEVIWAFTPRIAEAHGAEGHGGTADQIKAMAVIQCESGLDNMANFRRWGDGTRGIWSFMRHLRWPERLGFPGLDMYNNRYASFLASYMVFADVNPRVDPPNFWWWWSCSRSYSGVLRTMGIRSPETSYCPSTEYWLRVQPGSGVAARASCGA